MLYGEAYRFNGIQHSISAICLLLPCTLYFRIFQKKLKVPRLNSTRNTHRKYAPQKEHVKHNKNMGFYNSKTWRATSAKYRKDNPLCECCSNKSITTAAAHTDHIISIKQGGHKYNEANLMSLCVRCHSIKTQAEKEGILVEYTGINGWLIPVNKRDILAKVGGA